MPSTGIDRKALIMGPLGYGLRPTLPYGLSSALSRGAMSTSSSMSSMSLRSLRSGNPDSPTSAVASTRMFPGMEAE